MAKLEYGYFDGTTYKRYMNATSVKGAVRIAMKMILRAEGKKFNTEGLQSYYDEIAECMVENMRNDGRESSRTVIIPIDEMTSCFTNQGWICTGKGNEPRKCIDNSEYSRLVEEVINEQGVKEKELEVWNETEWEEILSNTFKTHSV